MKRVIYFTLVFVLTASVFPACSTKKNTAFRRGYHNLTARYNVYFNGNESFKKGQQKVELEIKDNYAEILPVFKYEKKETSQIAGGNMDVAIKKAAKNITSHSITAKPKKKDNRMTERDKQFYAKTEFCKWIDDSYMLMGKAHFYKKDIEIGMRSFRLVISQFKTEKTRFEAMLWMAKSYIELGKYSDAEDFLSNLASDPRHPKKLDAEINLTFADLYFKLEKNETAIDYLKLGIDCIKKKKNKARYLFILGQLYQKQGLLAEATNAYQKVIKTNPPYELIFNSRINIAMAFTQGSTDAGQLKRELQKLLKDDKNIEYQGQIYYALANIELKEGNTDKAIEYYLLSTQKNQSDLNQKALSFVALADLYFGKKDYKKSGAYYDSTMQYLNSDYSGYSEISKKASNLSELTKNLNEIEHQDSLQKIAKMDEKDRNILIDDIIQKVKDFEFAQKNQNETYYNYETSNLPENGTGGKWYFYNPNALSIGRSEFLKKWGDRKLEDNWRRRNKSIVANMENTDEKSQQNQTDSTRITDNKTRQFYLQDIPLTDSAMQKSNTKIINAYFTCASVYEKKMEDFEAAIQTYEMLDNRFPNNSFKLESYFQLYQLCEKTNRSSRADYYKNAIITQFPDSKYAKILSNPNYVNQIAAIHKQVSDFYETTYNLYLQNQYTQVIQNAANAISMYKENDLIPNFMYLKGLSHYALQETQAGKNQLTELISKYPNLPVTATAKEFMQRADVLNPDIYKINTNIPHLYMFAFKKNLTDDNSMKFLITSFNAGYTTKPDLTISDADIIPGYTVFIVSVFSNQAEAKVYLNTIQNSGIPQNMNKSDYSHSIISIENFEILKTDKNIEKYLNFNSKWN